MESAAMSSSRSLHHPGTPFDPYRDPFDTSSRGGASGRDGHEVAESWSSGGNDSESPPSNTNANNGMNGGAHSGDGSMTMQEIKDESSRGGAHEPKKKRFVCPHCERTFARSGHLQRHERSRMFPSLTKLFRSICSHGLHRLHAPSLYTVSRLVLRLDTNERPFQCPQCSSTFGRLDTLLRHERTLHGSSTSAASNNTTHQRTGSMNLGAKPVLGRSNSTTSQHTLHQHQHSQSRSQGHQSLDPPLSRVRESPTMTHHNINPSPIIPGMSPTHHNPQSPSLLLNGTSFSPPSNLLSNPSPSMVPPTLAHPTPHKAGFSPMQAESPALWDSFTSLDQLQPATPSASFGDIQSQFSRLLFNLLPSGTSVPGTPAPLTHTPAVAATPNLDAFIHSPSPMSFPLSSERGMVIPTHNQPISSPTNSSSSYPPGSKTSFLRSLEDFDRGVLETYIAECDMDVTLGEFELPKKDALNRYLCAYFEGMHQHHPFIHTPTFDPVSIKGNSPQL